MRLSDRCLSETRLTREAAGEISGTLSSCGFSEPARDDLSARFHMGANVDFCRHMGAIQGGLDVRHEQINGSLSIVTPKAIPDRVSANCVRPNRAGNDGTNDRRSPAARRLSIGAGYFRGYREFGGRSRGSRFTLATFNSSRHRTIQRPNGTGCNPQARTAGSLRQSHRPNRLTQLLTCHLRADAHENKVIPETRLRKQRFIAKPFGANASNIRGAFGSVVAGGKAVDPRPGLNVPRWTLEPRLGKKTQWVSNSFQCGHA